MGKKCLAIESDALKNSAAVLGEDFVKAVELISQVKGKVVLTGLGKSGHIATKIAATLASTGTTAIYLHPSEAMHGDLGVIDDNDALIAVAQGGETEEVIAVASYCLRLKLPVIAITGKKNSRLDKLANGTLLSQVDREACPLNIAPTASSTLAMALGDALATALMDLKNFELKDFAAFHPGGSLGKQLKEVRDFLVPSSEFNKVRVTDEITTIAQKLSESNHGIVGVIDDNNNVIGVVTDGDLRRAIEKFNAKLSGLFARDIMTSSPIKISENELAISALNLMEEKKVTTLIVVADNNSVAGIIRLHDLIEAKIY